VIKAIRGLGAKGLILDQDPYDVPMNAVSDGNNIRIVDGKISRMTGAQTIHNAAYYHMAPWFQASTASYILIDGTSWERYTSSTVSSDVTPTGTINNGKWNSTSVGESLIVNNGVDAPWSINSSISTFSTLSNWPANLRCSKIVPYSGFLIAIGIVDNGSEEPYVIRWSDTVTGSTLSPSWDYTLTTNLAGRNELAGGDGPILDVKQLGDQLIIYMRDAVYAMQFVGGQFVFNFRKIFDDDGIINQGAVTEFGGRHLVVGKDEIYVHDGSSKQSVSDGRVSRSFYDSLRNPESVRVERIVDRDEVWILYSADDDAEADRALIYNYQYNAWTRMDLPGRVAQVTVGPKYDSDLQVWSTTSGRWAEQSELWSTINPVQTDTTPYYVATDKVYQADVGFSIDGTPVESYIEQAKLDLDELFGETQSLKKIKRILPQISGTGVITMKVGTSDSPLGNIFYRRSAEYELETDHKVDLRAQGRYLAIRMEMTGSGQYELTGWDIDLDRGHGR